MHIKGFGRILYKEINNVSLNDEIFFCLYIFSNFSSMITY